MISYLLIKALSGQLNPLESEQLKIELSALERVVQSASNWIGNDGWPSLQWMQVRSANFNIMPTGGAYFLMDFTLGSAIPVPAADFAEVTWNKSLDSQFFSMRAAGDARIDSAPAMHGRSIVCYGNMKLNATTAGQINVALSIYNQSDSLITSLNLIDIDTPSAKWVSWCVPFSPSLLFPTSSADPLVFTIGAGGSVSATIFYVNAGLAVML